LSVANAVSAKLAAIQLHPLEGHDLSDMHEQQASFLKNFFLRLGEEEIILVMLLQIFLFVLDVQTLILA